MSVQVGWHSHRRRSGRARSARRCAARSCAPTAVVVTGGLGPTPDDITRKAVATVLERPLQLDEQVLDEHSRAREALGPQAPAASIESQALLPRGAQTWPNPLGTAPGLLILEGERAGDPAARRAARDGGARDRVRGAVSARSAPAATWSSFRRFAPPAYSRASSHERIGKLPQRLAGRHRSRYLPSYYGVDLRVTVAGTTPSTCARCAANARERAASAMVGSVVYAEGASDDRGGGGRDAARAQGCEWPTAESCTGGLLAKRMTDVPGSSRVLRARLRHLLERIEDRRCVGVACCRPRGARRGERAGRASQLASGARTRAGVEVGVGHHGHRGSRRRHRRRSRSAPCSSASRPGQETTFARIASRADAKWCASARCRRRWISCDASSRAAARSEPRGMRCDCFSRCSRRPRCSVRRPQ